MRAGQAALAVLVLSVASVSAARPGTPAGSDSENASVVARAEADPAGRLDFVQAAWSDSAELPASRWPDSTPAAGNDLPQQAWPNPTLVLVKSMVVPGWGQITNRRYFKAAIAIGLETWFIAGAVTEWRKANEARDDFRAEPGNISHFYDYEFHNGNKNDYLWALGVTVFISMFDAYVDAHLRPYRNDRIPDVNPPPGVAVVLLSF